MGLTDYSKVTDRVLISLYVRGKKGRGGDEDTGGKRKYYVKNRGYSFLTDQKEVMEH